MKEQIVTLDAVQLWTTCQGKGLPVMLCNGGPGCCDYLAPLCQDSYTIRKVDVVEVAFAYTHDSFTLRGAIRLKGDNTWKKRTHLSSSILVGAGLP